MCFVEYVLLQPLKELLNHGVLAIVNRFFFVDSDLCKMINTHPHSQTIAAPSCPECRQPLGAAELRAVLSDEQRAAFENRQARSALTDSVYALCANIECENVMERLPPADAEVFTLF
jgi:hypothetical protein